MQGQPPRILVGTPRGDSDSPYSRLLHSARSRSGSQSPSCHQAGNGSGGSSSSSSPRAATGYQSKTRLLAAFVVLALVFTVRQVFFSGRQDSVQWVWDDGSHLAALPQGDNGSYVAMCLAARDEHCDIREWVLHHASLGVGKFYIFDTMSDPPMQSVLDDFIGSGLVEYHFETPQSLDLPDPGPGRKYNWQRPIYNRCLNRYGKRHRWIGFLDADEFIILQDGVQSLPQLLQPREQHAGLVLHWQYFAFSGHLERPAGGVLASYTGCCPREHRPHRHIKSIVQPRFVSTPLTVHHFKYTKGRHAVNTAGKRVDGALLPKGRNISYAGAVIHHYITRSLTDFNVKMSRAAGDGSSKTLDHFLSYMRQCNETCPSAVPQGNRLRRQYDLQRNVPHRCLPAAVG